MNVQCDRCHTTLKTASATLNTREKGPKCGQILIIPCQPQNSGWTRTLIAGVVALLLLALVCLLVFNTIRNSPSDHFVAQNNNVDSPLLDVIPVDIGQKPNLPPTGQTPSDPNTGNTVTPQNPSEPEKLFVVPSDPGNKAGQNKDDKGGRLFTVLDVEFMGSKAKGKRICIIADVSDSMREKLNFYDPKTKKKVVGPKAIDYLKAELKKTLGSLKPEMEFFIILFNRNISLFERKKPPTTAGKTKNKKKPEPSHEWLTGKDIPEVRQWIDKISHDNGTNPIPAFKFAFEKLNPRPDVIFFMSDGNFSNKKVKSIAELNKSKPKVIINTILIQLNQSIKKSSYANMKEIAAESGGTFSQVDPSTINPMGDRPCLGLPDSSLSADMDGIVTNDPR